MVLKGADILGVKVISTKENKEVGKIKDLIYDPKKNKVTAFLVTMGDVLTEAQVIPFKEIQDVTLESVIIKSEKAIKPSSKAVKPTSNPDGSDAFLQDTKVLNTKGQTLGTFKDIFFDSKTGQVEGYKAQEGNNIPVKEVVGSTGDTTIIKDPQQVQREKSQGIIGKLKQTVGI